VRKTARWKPPLSALSPSHRRAAEIATAGGTRRASHPAERGRREGRRGGDTLRALAGWSVGTEMGKTLGTDELEKLLCRGDTLSRATHERVHGCMSLERQADTEGWA